MSKMKHLLRKLHIGGPFTDQQQQQQQQQHHHRPSVDQRPPSPSASASVGSSTSSALQSPANVPSTAGAMGMDSELDPDGLKMSSGSGSGSGKTADFNYFEEEFQMQMALAISVSDPDSRDDPETAQIKAAKQISLGCSPSQSLVELISLRYWTYSSVNYDEKIMDGFYDVHGINSNSAVQGKMPLMVDLAAVSVFDNYDYEVILVNREADADLRQLEESVVLISLDSQSSRKGLSRDLLVQKIANLVVNRMGGPVTDADEILKRWIARSYELRVSLNSIVLPLGCLDVGLSRHRALLFKVLADKINLPCMLVKGSYYTGTDEGAVNIIKFDNGSEYIIDLMGAPGTLIPAEIPSSQLPKCGFDMTNASIVPDDISNSHALATFPVLVSPNIDGNAKISTSTADVPYRGSEPKRDCGNAVGNREFKEFEHEVGNVFLSSDRIVEGQSIAGKKASAAQKKQVNDVSEYVITAAKDPEFAQKLRAVLMESGASPPLNLFSNISAGEYGKTGLLENQVTKEERGDGSQNYLQKYLSNNELSLIPFTGGRIFSSSFDGSELNLFAKGLAPQQLENASVVSHHMGSISSSNATGAKYLVGKAGKIGHDIDQYEESAMGEMQMAVSSKSEFLTAHNDQIDPLLGAVAEWEIPWEDLQIGERIGIGSYGEVYRAEWNGTEVAVKKFMNQDISGDGLELFKCEVEIMSRLRHPNVVLFMGAVTRPPNLSILTEFLPRGSLYKLLHRQNIQLDEKRRMRMALDVAKGMNYLHTSHPVIVHRDLKTPNLLVDKNWVVKVCDFGMSRMKHHTFLSSKSTAGTAEWMAPEVLRNEPSNEKSDVYSFGVILWELATKEVPWSGMHSMQVVGAVGFQGRHLDIPARVDPEVAEIITDCWNTIQQARPSFGQIITRLKNLKRLEVPKAEVSLNKRQG